MGGYCCIGVACDLFDPHAWSIADEGQVGDYKWNGADMIPNTSIFPEMSDYNGLADLNDLGVPFDVIADIIETVDRSEIEEFTAYVTTAERTNDLDTLTREVMRRWLDVSS